jgi:bifunctional DNA-binding transcriptional regulator/antitoxin component of YhaV-PrlF toxin-antitoxin module
MLKPITLTRIGKSGQVILPKEILKSHHLEKGSQLLLIEMGEVLLLVPHDQELSRICRHIQEALSGQGITPSQAKARLRRVRRRRFKERFADLQLK